jgi:hypothetical protein
MTSSRGSSRGLRAAVLGLLRPIRGAGVRDQIEAANHDRLRYGSISHTTSEQIAGAALDCGGPLTHKLNSGIQGAVLSVKLTRPTPCRLP